MLAKADVIPKVLFALRAVDILRDATRLHR
jgi:hypothetical protein